MDWLQRPISTPCALISYIHTLLFKIRHISTPWHTFDNFKGIFEVSQNSREGV